eukprot:scaffold62068_cov28-Attheya_sp.AAC.1
MIHGRVYLSECFHEETNTIQGAPDLKLVDEKTQLWMLNKADSPELEEQALASIIAYMNRFDGSLVHRFVPMLPPERRFFHVICHQGFVMWSHDEVADVVAHQSVDLTVGSLLDWHGFNSS